MKHVFQTAFTFLVILAAASAGLAQSAPTGTLTGRVLDAATGAALPGATITVSGTIASASTDRDGRFRIAAIPGGTHEVTVRYIGRDDAILEIEIKAGTQAQQDFQLKKSPKFSDEVTVSGLIVDAQERALNQQKTAANISNIVSASQIGSFPDPNAAEVTSRVPGVSITRDMGEGRYVIIRGTEARLNSTLINGERVPAPEADVRQVAMDVIPSDLLQSVEVSKALTPDVDGDAIGGSVNLVMKNAAARPQLFGSIGGGYNSSRDSYNQGAGSVTLGRRFNDNKAGLIVSGSTMATNRGTQDFEPAYAGNLTLADLDLRQYLVDRRRHGLTGGLDFRPNANTALKFTGVYNYYIDDHEQRQRVRLRLANRRIERELRDRTHIEHINSAAVNLQHQMNRLQIDVHGARNYSDQKDPGTIATVFRQSNVNFSPNVTATSIDPDNIQANPLNENIAASTFNSQVLAINSATELDYVGAIDLRLAAASSASMTSFLKVGLKYRDKSKTRTRDEVTRTTSQSIPITSVLQLDGASHSILDGRYNLGQFVDVAKTDSITTGFTSLTTTPNHSRDSENFDASEKVLAGYVMTELFAGQKVFFLPGVRFERTEQAYNGNQVNFLPNGTWLSTTPIAGRKTYTDVMPGAHLRVALTPDTNFRAAVTRTIARPNYIDLVPYRVFDDSANTIALGNSELNPTHSWNVDVMVERYLKSVGVIQAGYFYKNLKNYIYKFTTNQTISGENFVVTQPLNGDAATISGVELAAQSQLRFLPAPLDGFGIYLNYTYADSNATFPARPGEKASLPGQSKHVGNVSVSYEKRGFSGRYAVNFHGHFIDAVGASTGLDRVYDTHKQQDITLSQKITKNIRAYANVLNLSDAPLRYYQGAANYPLQEEHYKWWAEFGVKINFSGK